MNEETLSTVVSIAKHVSGLKSIDGQAAVDQDLQIAGDDVAEFVDLLAEKYGQDIYSWPWKRFVILGEGLSILFLPVLVWQLLSWPFRGSFGYPNNLERLALIHIARCLEAGHWIEP